MFPPGYVEMDCSSAESIIQEKLKRQAEARKRREAFIAAERAAQAKRDSEGSGDVTDTLARSFAASGKWVNDLAEVGIRSALDGILPARRSKRLGPDRADLTGAIIGFILWAGFRLGSKLAWEWVKRKVFKTR
jgi:hypothetical protein